MPRMKLTDDEFDEDELDVEYEGSNFVRYSGEIPKTGTILIVRVTKMWWTQSSDGTSMIALIAVAEQNTGALAEFNDLPTWDYLTFKKEAAFRYVPFLENFGILLKDIKKKMMVADNDDNIGTPIEAIGGWEVGSDDALARIVIKRDRYEGEWKSKVDIDGWMEYEEPEDEEEDEDEAPDEEVQQGGGRRTRPARSRSAKSAASSKSGAASTSHSRKRPEPEPEDDDDYDDVEDEEGDDYEDEPEEAEEKEEEAPTRASSRRASASRTTTRHARPAARGTGGGRRTSARSTTTKTRSAESKGKHPDDPPF